MTRTSLLKAVIPLFENLLAALAYLGLGMLTMRFFAEQGMFPSPLWPPAAIALVALMLRGERVLPGLLCAAFLVSQFSIHSAPLLSLMLALAATLGPYAGVVLMRRRIREHLPFHHLSDVARFTGFGVLLPTLLTAGGSVLALYWLGGLRDDQLAPLLLTWGVSNAGGVLFFAPALLLRLSPADYVLTRRQSLEAAAIAALTLAATVAMFIGVKGQSGASIGLPYLLALPMLWMTARFPPREAHTLLLSVTLIALYGTVTHQGAFHFAEYSRSLGIAALMIVSLALTVLAIGALVSERRRAEQGLQESNHMLESRVEERTQQLQQRLSEIEALQANLREQAVRDALTGLYNRRYLTETLEREFARAARENVPISVIMMDVDHFKKVNDTHGHKAGDEVLVALGVLLQETTRESDISCRYGGEEFVIVMPRAPLEVALERAEALRQAFEAHPVPVGETVLHATVSLGVAVYPQHGTHPDELMRAADTALYAAKSGGRNRVVAAS